MRDHSPAAFGDIDIPHSLIKKYPREFGPVLFKLFRLSYIYGIFSK